MVRSIPTSSCEAPCWAAVVPPSLAPALASPGRLADPLPTLSPPSALEFLDLNNEAADLDPGVAESKFDRYEKAEEAEEDELEELPEVAVEAFSLATLP